MERFDHRLFPVTLETLDDDLFDIHCTHYPQVRPTGAVNINPSIFSSILKKRKKNCQHKYTMSFSRARKRQKMFFFFIGADAERRSAPALPDHLRIPFGGTRLSALRSSANFSAIFHYIYFWIIRLNSWNGVSKHGMWRSYCWQLTKINENEGFFTRYGTSLISHRCSSQRWPTKRTKRF